MPTNRREFLKMPAGLLAAGADLNFPKRTPGYEKPLFQLHQVSSTPVKIASIELLGAGSNYFVRATSADGAVGISRTKQVREYVPILLGNVAPYFVGKDARDLETLIDGVYIENYKMAGQALWAPVAYVEQALFDLLGKIARKPVGELLGGVIRREIPVYLSGSGRETTAEQEVEVYVKAAELTRARAVKFKIGGRMSRNLDPYPGRTKRMLDLARRRLGDQMIIYADANGSYDSAAAIEVGKFLEGLKCGFFEEPCPWEELGETKRVADALSIPVAAGEQDASLWRFQWMMDNRVMDIVQFDLNYNGGFIRGARVARLARERKMTVVPHNTQTDASAANMLQFASATSNIGPYMEFPCRGPHKPASWFAPNFPIQDGVVKVPAGPGLGIEYDPEYLKKARKVGIG